MAQQIKLADLIAELKTQGFSQFSSDLKGADKQISAFSKSLNKVGDQFIKTGKALTTKLTLPIVGVGAAVTKLAADFEVASRKFSKAFEGAGDDAAAAVQNLSDNFGLAESQATQLLAFTGDLLKGFGATSDQALELSTDVQELAAALSAYSGVPIAQASEAATKALLGETEQLKSLGVVIRQADVDQQLLVNGTENLTGQELLLARAQATLQLAFEQSSDAVNSFSDNQDTLAFQSQQLLGEIKDLGVEFGTILLPIVKDVVAQIREGVDFFAALDDNTKKNIITIAALAAALGPVAIGIGTVIKSVAALNTALAFLAANPVVAAIAGIAALTAGTVALIKLGQERRLDALNEQFGELAAATGVADGEMDEFLKTAEEVDGLLAMNQWGASVGEVSRLLGTMVESSGLTRDQVVGIVRESEILNDEFKEIVATLEQQRQVTEDLSGETARQEQNNRRLQQQQERILEVATEQAEEQQRITEELERQNQIERERIAQVISGRTDAEAAYYKEINDAQDRLNLGLIDEQELQEARLAASETYADRLIQLGYDGRDAAQVGNRALLEQVELINQLSSELQAAGEEEVEVVEDTEEEKLQVRQDFEDQWLDTLFNSQSTKEQLLERDYQAAIDQAEELGADRQAIEEFYAAEREALRQEELEQIADQAQAITDTGFGIAGQISDIFDQQTTNAKAQLDNFLYVNGEELKALQEKADAGETLTDDEKERLEELNDEKRKLLQEQYEAELKAFQTQKAIRIAETIMTGANAAISAYNSLAVIPIVGPALGIAAAGAVAALTVKQLDLIKSQQPPPPPELATGGIVQATRGGTTAIIGEGGNDEAVLPLTDETFNNLGSAIVESQQGTAEAEGGGTQSLTIILEGLGRLTIPSVQQAANNGQLRIPASAITRGV